MELHVHNISTGNQKIITSKETYDWAGTCCIENNGNGGGGTLKRKHMLQP